MGRRLGYGAPLALAFSLSCVWLSGCGGGGASAPASIAQATTPVKFAINWPARSRAVNAPTSALSAVVSLSRGSVDSNGPVTFPVINRVDDPASYVQNYEAPVRVRPGATVVTVTFYAQKDAGGAVVGVASRSVVAADDVALADFALSGTIESVSVTAPASVDFGATGQLTVAALDGVGASVAITPGSATFVRVSGESSFDVSADGVVTPKALGSGTVRATIDSKTSAAFTVTVAAPAGSVARVDPDQRVPLGASRTLSSALRTSAGAVIPADPSLTAFRVVSGDDILRVTPAGVATGLRVGIARVAVTIAGVESAPVDVVVDPGAVASVAIVAQQTVAVGAGANLALIVKDSAGNDISVESVTVSLAEVEPRQTLLFGEGARVSGLKPGFAVVRATINGVTSAPQAVLVGDLVSTGSGLKYIELEPGTGEQPSESSSVTVDYTGNRLDGFEFDSSRRPGRTPFTFTIGQGVILGFSEGVRTMRVGGRRLLVIPPELGYGDRGSGSDIPPGATLLFDISLISVNS